MTRNSIKKFLLIFLVASVLGMAVYTTRTYASYQKAQLKWKNSMAEVTKVEQEISRIKMDLVSYQSEMDELHAYLFAERDVPAFLEHISEFAADSHINILDMKTLQYRSVPLPQAVAESQSPIQAKRKTKAQEAEEKLALSQALTIAALPIKVKVEGAYKDLAKFLADLEDYKQLLTLNSVEISSNRKYPLLDCEFMLNIYSLKTLAELGY